jgi:hypothetical protein
MVRFFFAAVAAFRTFFRAALFYFSLGISSLFLMAFKVLHGSFVRLGLLQRLESSQVPPLAGFYIFLAGVTDGTHPISIYESWLSSRFSLQTSRMASGVIVWPIRCG